MTENTSIAAENTPQNTCQFSAESIPSVVSELTTRSEKWSVKSGQFFRVFKCSVASGHAALASGFRSKNTSSGVRYVQSAARACVDKYTPRNSEGDPAAYKG